MGQGAPINMRVPVNVINSDVTGVTIQAAPAFLMEITGRARMEADAELPARVTVSLQLAESSRSFIPPGLVQEDGTFRIGRVPPGKYLVYADSGAGNYTKQVLAGGADVLHAGLDLSQPQAAPVLEVVLSPKAPMLEGVALRDDKPWPNAYVTLVPDPMRAELRFLMGGTRADRNGRFTLKGLTPGDYKLYAWEESVSLVNVPPQELQPYESDSVSVRLVEGESKQVEVQVAPPR